MCKHTVCTCAESKGKDAIWPESKHSRTGSEHSVKVERKTVIQADTDNVEIDRKNKRVENKVTEDKKLEIVCVIKNLANNSKEKGKTIN